MPITLTDVSADADALAADYNANLQKIRDKMSTTAGVGVGDADIATDAGINGNKLSTTNRVPEDRLASLAVSARVLRSDAAVSANRAVTADHVRDLAIAKKHINTASPLTNAQVEIKEQTAAFSLTGTVAINHLCVQRRTLAGNYEFTVTNHVGSTTSAHVLPALATPIPVASNRIINAYIADVVPGVTTTGTLVVVWIPLT